MLPKIRITMSRRAASIDNRIRLEKSAIYNVRYLHADWGFDLSVRGDQSLFSLRTIQWAEQKLRVSFLLPVFLKNHYIGETKAQRIDFFINLLPVLFRNHSMGGTKAESILSPACFLEEPFHRRNKSSEDVHNIFHIVMISIGDIFDEKNLEVQ